MPLLLPSISIGAVATRLYKKFLSVRRSLMRSHMPSWRMRRSRLPSSFVDPMRDDGSTRLRRWSGSTRSVYPKRLGSSTIHRITKYMSAA
jgi:hypothetical protein